MRGYSVLAFGLLACWLSACYEPPVGVKRSNLTAPELPVVAVNFLEDDSLYVYEKLVLVVTFDSAATGYADLVATLDGTLLPLSSEYGRPNEFLLDPVKFTNGHHVLKITAKVALYGPSIQSRFFGHEFHAVERQYAVEIDLIPPPQPQLSFAVTNGILTLHWNPATKHNFKNYLLKRFVKNSQGNWYEYASPFTISKDSARFVDKGYIGYDIKYEINIQGYQFNVSNSRDTSIVAWQVNWEPLDINTVRFYWDQPPLYGALSILSMNPVNFPPVSNDFQEPIPFGKPAVRSTIVQGYFDPNILTTPNQFAYLSPFTGLVTEYQGLGTQIQKGSVRFGNQEIIVLQESNQFIVHKVNSATSQVEQTTNLTSYLEVGSLPAQQSHQWFASPDGAYFYILTGSGKLHQFNSAMAFVKTMNVASFFPNYIIMYGLSASNNGLVAGYVWPGGISVLDVAQDQVYFAKVTDSQIANLSADGSRFANGAYVMDVNGTDLDTLITNLPEANRLYRMFFKENNDDELILVYYDKVTVYSVSLGAPIASVSMPAFIHACQYDPISGKIGITWLTSNKTYFRIFNPATNQLEQDIWINSDIVTYWNNTLTSRDGYRISL